MYNVFWSIIMTLDFMYFEKSRIDPGRKTHNSVSIKIATEINN